MKVYQISWQEPDEGSCQHWSSSQAEARAFIRSMLNEDQSFRRDDFTIRQMSIPIDKHGLLNWLNTWFIRDNG